MRLLKPVVAALGLLLLGCAQQPAETAQTTFATTPSPSQVEQQEPETTELESQSAAGSSPATPRPAAPAPDCSVVACLALTFDDGPTGLTDQLVETLVAHDARATFFLNAGYATNNPEVVLRTQQAGMEIASHTTNHTNLALQSAETIAFEISDAQQRIEAITGQAPTLLRPPHGSYNHAVLQIAGQHGLAVVNWTDGPADWVNRDTTQVVDRTLAVARPGAIILLHDTYQWTVDAAPAIITGLQRQGYQLVTVSELLGTPQPGTLYGSGQAPA